MKRMSTKTKSEVLTLLNATAYKQESWCSNWAWQATGIPPVEIHRVIRAAEVRGLVRKSAPHGWFRTTQTGQDWFRDNTNWKPPKRGKKIPAKKSPAKKTPARKVKKNRPLLTNHQCRTFMKDMNEFGYRVTFDQVRRIADQVHEGTQSDTDPVAIIMMQQIDEAMDAVRDNRKLVL